MENYLTEEQIMALYIEFKTPPNVIRHCGAVANVAMTIAEALNAHGFDLDIDLIIGAGLCHDVARTQARHWDVMADKLLEMGYLRESLLVRNHMTGDGYHAIKEVSEMDMLWLGDRLVLEDQYVGIDKRFEYIIEKALKFGGGDKDVERILKSKAKMKALMDSIEEVIGQSIDSLFVKEEESENE